ncbi:hypothetical protein AEQ27_16215 [Frigoribacterium sp. RIT-PI-h]|nr:hypothetical protein AEQ27_16215 [Frigoribacterium sp. RIT-PI-h]
MPAGGQPRLTKVLTSSRGRTSATAPACIPATVTRPPWLGRNAVSEASRPVAMRSNVCRGASPVASTTCQAPSTKASATAWKSIGDKPGA